MIDEPLILRAASVIQRYAKGADDRLSRLRIMPAMLKKHGRISYRNGGPGFSWQFEFRQAQPEANNGAQPVTPTPVDRYKRSELGYTGYVIHDKMSLFEYLANRDTKAQLINTFEGLGKKLIRDMGDGIHPTFYADGTGTAMKGFLSFTAYTQTMQEGASTPTARSANVLDRLAWPNDSYAGFSTVLGALGGSWTGDYCGGGTGTTDFDVYTPLIVRCKSSAFNGSTTWAANCVEAIRYGGMMNLLRKAQGEGHLDTVIMPSNMWNDVANKLDAKERVTVKDAFGLPHYGQDTARGVIMIDGLKLMFEYGVPANKAFGINWSSVEYRSMLDQMVQLDHDSPKWVGTDSGWHWIARMHGNYAFLSPRDFVLWDNDYSN